MTGKRTVYVVPVYNLCLGSDVRIRQLSGRMAERNAICWRRMTLVAFIQGEILNKWIASVYVLQCDYTSKNYGIADLKSDGSRHYLLSNHCSFH